MATAPRSSIANTIPDSKLPSPAGLHEQVLHYLWRGIYPFWGDIRDTFLKLGLISHQGRQNYVLGKIGAGRKVEDFLKYLEAKEFGNHFVAWIDDDELIGLRRLDGFEHQYHLRIFKDGEVRGHYEFTPESHPILHAKDRGVEERRADFLAFCGDWIAS